MIAIPHAGVIVTGAGGRTGKIVVRKLLVDSRRDDGTFAYRVCAVVRSGEEKLLSYLRENESCFVDSAIETGSLFFANIDFTFEAAEAQLTETFQKLGYDGSVGLVVCSSAMPKINMSSLFGVIFWNKLLGYKDVRPTFHFKEAAQEPKSVDYEGQLRQFSAARASGISTHVVVVSSMAGTDPSHFLNQNMQNMVLWKRKAEKALVEAGDLPYTIIHPGGLLPHVGTSKNSDKGGERARARCLGGRFAAPAGIPPHPPRGHG